jgi:hypothetical protein
MLSLIENNIISKDTLYKNICNNKEIKDKIIFAPLPTKCSMYGISMPIFIGTAFRIEFVLPKDCGHKIHGMYISCLGEKIETYLLGEILDSSYIGYENIIDDKNCKKFLHEFKNNNIDELIKYINNISNYLYSPFIEDDRYILDDSSQFIFVDEDDKDDE